MVVWPIPPRALNDGVLRVQVPDGFAAYVLARRRDEEQAHDAESVAGSAASTQMAISGCFGAPIFNILVVLSVALLTEALHLPHGGERAAAAFCRPVLPIRSCVDKLVLCFRCHLLPTCSVAFERVFQTHLCCVCSQAR